MATIEVDFEIYKALTMRRPTESTTYSDVIASLLGIQNRGESLEPKSKLRDWVYKDARCPHGTEWRAFYKGFPHRAEIVDGVLMFEGRPMNSPSEAAQEVTNTSVNGWTFGSTGCRIRNDGARSQAYVKEPKFVLLRSNVCLFRSTRSASLADLVLPCMASARPDTARHSK